ncbi:MAG: alpha/beta hydrolase [Acetobacteraceae bacterium]|nr:MAG: alpha/beta hydrolase [Acetobacteraceae bacterium]
MCEGAAPLHHQQQGQHHRQQGRTPDHAVAMAHPPGAVTLARGSQECSGRRQGRKDTSAMIETQQVETGPGLVFDVSVAGDPAAPLVLLLHGFGVSRHLYDAQLPALAAAGFRAAAPNQRGYSPGARPDPADFARYDIELLIADALDLAEALGQQDRFHLVGHDWGGSLSWEIAARYPDRLASLTMLSRPHPGAFARALAEDPEQPHRSRHHKAFLEADAVPKLLAEDAAWLRTRHAAQGIPAAATAKHLSVIGNPEAMAAALAWYRARGTVHRPIRPIDTVGRIAAEGTGGFIEAPYQFEILPGVGHYAPDQQPEVVNRLLLAHLSRNPL